MLAYVDGTNVTAQGGDILIQATEAATIEAYTSRRGVRCRRVRRRSRGRRRRGGSGLGKHDLKYGQSLRGRRRQFDQHNRRHQHERTVDTPTIVANAGGVAIGIGVSTGSAGVAASVGVAAAVNNVNDYVYAYINDSSATAAGSLAIWSNTGGDIVFQTPDELNTGDTIVFHVGSAGAAPGGLVDGTTYYVVKLSDNEIALADSLADVLAGKTIPITSSGSGTGMSLALASGSIVDNFGASDVAAAGSIQALSIGGAVAVGASSNTGVGVSAAGAGSGNTVTNTVEAYIEDVNAADNQAVTVGTAESAL